MKNIFIALFFVSVHGNSHSQAKVLFTSGEKTRVSSHSYYYYQFSAADSDGRSISYAVKKLPQWLHFNLNDHSISGKSVTAGQFPVEIIAYTKKDTSYQPFMLTVFNRHTENILCLGNSITNGVDTFNSYRRDLWHMLHASHYNFDFIGSWSQHHMGSSVPVPDFDLDHEGHSGWTFEDILKPPSWDSARGNLHLWIREYTPSIVLIELGTNDIFHCRKQREIFDDLTGIIALLRTRNKHVKILLAQIPPLGPQWSDKKLCGNDVPYAEAIISLNKEIMSYSTKHSTSRLPIKVVDQFSGVDPSTDMFDDIHPNTTGESKMAERWFEAIRPYLKRLPVQ